jgi:PAS domain S-box-containing protein
MNSNLRPSGIEAFGDMAWGTHFCLFYETKQDLLETLAGYFKTGLANNEFCLWITPDSSNGTATKALRQVIPSADMHLEKGDIEILSCQQWYCENDKFDGARAIETFEMKLAQALEKGYTRMKVLADEAWLDEDRWKVFSDYEGKIDEVFATRPISIVCAYPTVRHNAADILDVARTHHFIAAKRNGNWEILESPELRYTKAESERLGTELRDQVPEKEKFDSLQGPSLILRYGVPVLAVALSLAGTFLLQPYDFRTPLFLLSIMISTWVGGIGPGMLAVLLSTLAINLFLSPAGIVETSYQNIPNVISFLITAFLLGSWSEERRRAGHALWKARDDLDEKVQDRTADLKQVNQALQAEIIGHKRSEEALRTNESRLQAAIDAADIGLWDWDLVSGQIIWLGHHEKLFGFAIGEFDGTYRSFEKRVHPEDLEELNRVVQFALGEGSEYAHEYRVVWPDGSIHWITGHGRFVYDETGKPMRMRGAVLDITERKRAEEALRKSERVLREAESLGHTGSWEQDLVTGEIFNTEENLRLFFGDDLSKGGLFEDYAQAVHPDDREIVMRRRVQLLEGGPGEIEYRVVWPDGSVHVIFGRATIIRDQSGQAIRVYGTNVDITERKQAEDALRLSESNFRTLADKSLEGIQLYQGERSVYANAAMTAILGYTEEEFKAMSMEEHIAVVHPLDRAIAVERARRRQTSQEVPASLEVRILTKAGATRWVQGFTNTIDYNGQPAIISTAIDITERKQAEEELRIQKEILQKIFDHTPMMIGMIGADGQWRMVNRAWEHTIGWKLEELQQPNFDVLAEVYPDPQEHQRVMDFIAAKSEKWEEFRARARDGRLLDATFTNVYLSDGTTLGFGLDISERKKAEEEIKRQAARAETLARIAARLNKQLDLNAVIQAVCEEAVNTFKVSQATMSLYDKKRDLLVYAGGVNIPPEYAASMEPITRSQFDDFLQEMGPIMVASDIQSLPDVPNAEFSSQRDVRTVVTAAMFRDHELIGALVIGVNSHVRDFNQDELTLLKAISDQAAQAIANALLLKAANEQHEQLRDLSTKLVEVQETERQALTTELHDRVGQNLTGLSINLQNMKALLSGEMAKTLATKFDDAQALVEHTTRQIRDIMAELHPPELEDYGLAVALETYAERAASRGNLELIADLPDLTLPHLPSDVRIALFRAAQEAISNVLKHANATRLEISMEAQDGRIRLRVEDDGQGFELDAPSQKEAQTWGLKIMRERIESIGGNVHIESNLGAGTKVTFEIQRPS